MYDYKNIEKKWQDKWIEDKAFAAIDFDKNRKKYYVLYEFFNVSGDLHMGHLKGSVPADVLARYKRFLGYNVLFPIGGDSFGLPSENAARKTKISPQEFVEKTYAKQIEQCQRLALSFDYDRGFCTSDKDFFKWTQWIFYKLFEHGKAYKKKGVVNFCTKCQTVLSNEDSQGGRCDRCNSIVEQRERWVWFLKMQEYSQKLLDNVDRIDMAHYLKEAQRNWIGKSEGIEVVFDVVDDNDRKIASMPIFTTAIETIFGVTFVTVAPEHSFVDKVASSIKNFDEVKKYRIKTAKKSNLDRQAQKDKTGVELKGIYAVNPLNGAKKKIFAGDYVIATYGTGAVMGVPAHDQRDFEFAQKMKLPIVQVIAGDVSKQAVEKDGKDGYMTLNSKMLNSGKFDGMGVVQAKKGISDELVKKGAGSIKVNYKMADWPFNRQRYWGEPFPVVLCDDCKEVLIDLKELPLDLPVVTDYSPNEEGDSPLSKATDWVKCKCPKCGKAAKRETDTMPNWAGSSWYWLRFIDPHNDKELASMDKLKYWGSVDCYTGGTEHITRHVLYAFFWQNFLYEIGAVPSRDPFVKKMGSGLVLDDEGKKMSKSSANGVSPMEVVDKYGTDVTRLHLNFLCAYEDSCAWTYKGIEGIIGFVKKVWDLQTKIKGDAISKEHIGDINRLIKFVGEDYEAFKLNTAIANFMKFVNKVKTTGFITKKELEIFLILLNPLAPHITSELFSIVFNKDILTQKWPKVDEGNIHDDIVMLPIQINGKVKKQIQIARDMEQDKVIDLIAKTYPDMKPKEAKKVIFVKNRIINLTF